MIFARDKSQMCNNLLQFAHVYAWGRKHGQRVISMRFSYKYPYFKIQQTRYAGFFWYLFAKYAAALKLLHTVSFKRADHREEKIHYMESHRHFVVSGWFARFYDEFLEYRDEICDLFQLREEYMEPLRKRMEVAMSGTGANALRLGLHIRRGDYKDFYGGKYFYDNATYAAYVMEYARQHVGKDIVVFISTNDKTVSVSDFEKLCQSCKSSIKFIMMPENNPAQDMVMLSECDAIIGPPSTFSLTASMYHDIPLCWMEEISPANMQFDKFENHFRNIR
jgi:hypothetical protein